MGGPAICITTMTDVTNTGSKAVKRSRRNHAYRLEQLFRDPLRDQHYVDAYETQSAMIPETFSERLLRAH